MAILTRLTRLFRADLHAVLDRLEEPDLLLRQAVRDMDQTFADGERQAKARELERKQLARRRDEIVAAGSGIDAELDLCFAAGNTTLARMLLRRRMEGERLVAQLDRHAGRLDAAIAQDRDRLDEQRRQLEELRAQAAVYESCGSDDPKPVWSAEGIHVSDADVELALLREQGRRA